MLTSAAVTVGNPDGNGRVLILCEHASNAIPDRYDGLGLSDADRHSHAAWDPGALPLAQLLSKALDAPLVASNVSRLVYDCNRPPEAPSAMPEKSELIDVPGNYNLTQAQKDERVETIYEPFCAAVAERLLACSPIAVVTIHSFTPVFFGTPREIEVGILHDSDTDLADAMIARAGEITLRVGRNEPYGPQDGVTHSLKLHGISNGIANVMIEVRNDLIATPEQQRDVADQLLTLLRPALTELEAPNA